MVGNLRKKWMPKEEEAVRAGVAKHGVGEWKCILSDTEFSQILYPRSNINLKGKWGNMKVASGQQKSDRSKAPKGKGSQADAPATPVPIAHTSARTLGK